MTRWLKKVGEAWVMASDSGFSHPTSTSRAGDLVMKFAWQTPSSLPQLHRILVGDGFRAEGLGGKLMARYEWLTADASMILRPCTQASQKLDERGKVKSINRRPLEMPKRDLTWSSHRAFPPGVELPPADRGWTTKSRYLYNTYRYLLTQVGSDRPPRLKPGW